MHVLKDNYVLIIQFDEVGCNYDLPNCTNKYPKRW